MLFVKKPTYYIRYVILSKLTTTWNTGAIFMIANEYISIAIFIGVTALIAVIAIVLGTLFGPQRPGPKKNMPYESGMDPIGPGQRRMPVRFYLISVLFILFDIEVVFLVPWALIFSDFVERGQGLFLMVEMLVFILILLVGYAYAWKKGALEWE